MSARRKVKIALPLKRRSGIIGAPRATRAVRALRAGNGEIHAVSIPALPPGVKLTTLDNGLIIIVREDRSAPVVAAQAWCATGSISEGRWMGAGLSHVLEHMLFKGTAT